LVFTAGKIRIGSLSTVVVIVNYSWVCTCLLDLRESFLILQRKDFAEEGLFLPIDTVAVMIFLLFF
jgi:hypothetical protein